MATTNTFVIEYGLSVGSTEVINSSGKIIASALSTIDTDDITEGSTFYHATSVDPKWRYTKAKTVQIGQHIFYGEK